MSDNEIIERFKKDTVDHILTIELDQPPFRSLMCQKPGTWVYAFRVVTFPGHVTIAGDMGSFTWSRLEDMFYWGPFGGEGFIDWNYTAEKVVAVDWPEGLTEYSEMRAREWLEEQEIEEGEYARQMSLRDILRDLQDLSEAELHRRLYEELEEWEVGFRVPTFRFQWNVLAVRWARDKYMEWARDKYMEKVGSRVGV